MTGPTSTAVDLPIALGQFVKLAGLAETGGGAKILVASGLVRVNGQVENRRGRKLAPGDIVQVGDHRARVVPAGGEMAPPTLGG